MMWLCALSMDPDLNNKKTKPTKRFCLRLGCLSTLAIQKVDGFWGPKSNCILSMWFGRLSEKRGMLNIGNGHGD